MSVQVRRMLLWAAGAFVAALLCWLVVDPELAVWFAGAGAVIAISALFRRVVLDRHR